MPGESLTLNERETVLLSLLTVWSLVWSVYIGYWSYVLWQVRHLYWMKSRWSEVDVIILIMLGQIYICGRPLVYYQDIREADLIFSEMNRSNKILLIGTNMISVVPITGVVMLLCLRWWKSYYDAQLAVALGVSKWAVILDSSLADSEEQCWFVRNKRWIGNHVFLDHCGITIWLITALIGCVIPFVSQLLESIFYLTMAVVGMAVVGYCGYFYPPFHDKIFLEGERRNFVRAMVSFAIIWFVWVQWYRWAGFTYEDDRMIRGLDSFFRQCMLCLNHSIASFFLVPYVVQNFNKPNRTISLCSFTIPVSIDLSTFKEGRENMTEPQLNLRNCQSDTLDSSVKIERVMADNDAFRAFMVHLFAEFSYENALCLIECVKFRDRMRMLEEVSEMEDFESIGMPQIEFCENVKNIRSSIVSQMKNKEEAREIAVMIAQKYLRSDADFPVNLSYVVRKKVLNNIDDSHYTIEHKLFDHIIQANYRFLKESFSRFAVTLAFAQLSIIDKRSSALAWGSEVINKVRGSVTLNERTKRIDNCS